MPSIPELAVRLRDDVVQLRDASEWDIPEILIAHQDDRQLHARLGRRRPPTGAQLGNEIAHLSARREAGTGASLTLLEPGGIYCCGRLEVSAIDWSQRRAVLSVWVAPQLRGRGMAAHALRLASEWLESEVGLSELTVALVIDGDETRAG